MYGITRPSKVGNSHLAGCPSGRINGIVNPKPPIFQSPCKEDKQQGFQFRDIQRIRIGRRLTAVVIRILSGEMLEWIKRAEVWRKESPLHSWRIPFWI